MKAFKTKKPNRINVVKVPCQYLNVNSVKSAVVYTLAGGRHLGNANQEK